MRKQRGGSSSDFMHSFYANTAVGGPAAITRAGLETIDQAPMFNPLGEGAVFPTVATGIVPSGVYLANPQMGGGRSLTSMTISELRTLCNKLGLSCKDRSGLHYLPKSILITRISAAEQMPIDISHPRLKQMQR